VTIAIHCALWNRSPAAHADGTVTSSDLKFAMKTTSGRDLRSLFMRWVYGEPPLPPDS
jgi:aminopeptidase N